jgi:hypothetical protein
MDRVAVTVVSGRKRKGVPGSSSQPGRRSTSSKPESSGTINDPLHAAAFAVWGPLLDEQPRLAHAAYHWNREEDR